MSSQTRQAIAEAYLRDETDAVARLVPVARLAPGEARETDRVARLLVAAARDGRRRQGGIDRFMQEYDLSTEEGIALLCVAEAMLRIPDTETVDELIESRIGSASWRAHLGESDSLFVNASTYGLVLGARVLRMADDAGGLLPRLVGRMGEPVVRAAIRQAMLLLAGKFVMGETIEKALKATANWPGYRFSFDMLGEAAMTAAQAQDYFDRYLVSIMAVAKGAGPFDPLTAPGVSVKLSALHPRYEPGQRDRVMAELVPKLHKLAVAARGAGVLLTVDAEEAARLDLSLEVIEAVADAPGLAGWDGFGLAVQAYGKRAMAVLDWLAEKGRVTGRRWPVRLVKGAYWDSEIKLAQQLGLDEFPVFTRKGATDVSYLACARRMLAQPYIVPQFATHNAHTVAAVHAMAGGRSDYEFQRLFGMGDALHEQAVKSLGVSCRIYAPVGSHETLLPYLVRRLLENGANTSFVNRLADDDVPVEAVIADPVERVAALKSKPHPAVRRPADLYQPERRNARGLIVSEPPFGDAIRRDMAAALAVPLQGHALVGGQPVGGEPVDLREPADRSRLVGTMVNAGAADVDRALSLAVAAAASWDQRGGAARAAILEKAADLFERDRALLMALCVREGGKTVPNALAELREATDFLRYYAAQARLRFERPMVLPGPDGERNELTLRGRGVFACISPWNFPLAIFTGQVAAALAAGNAVCAKPAGPTPLTGFAAIRLLHEAGVPVDVLHFLPGRGAAVGGALIGDRRIAGVAFTGSNDTADNIQRNLAARGGAIVPFIAETGGINAMIIDSSALLERAVADAIRSAFDSAGQRCSAARVVFVQADVHDAFTSLLTGAMAELRLGDPISESTDIGPIIDETSRDKLAAYVAEMSGRGLDVVSSGTVPRDGVFLQPHLIRFARPQMPAREVFGPVLHVAPYAGESLDGLCDLINGAGFGLTLSLHTRLPSVIDRVAARMKVGNIYVNRDQIGAVVGIQPFGGEGLSGTGPKAGGPHYLTRFSVERAAASNVAAIGGVTDLLSLDPWQDVP
ncbi:bifunctional proline dehydrogenase/L-glutamate gamma-semialdehyde dehydrogenase PutA [Emcibacter sp. SYSU 3D8]|uniref:bifunctional proline dehydrogenase/L-glutamate gamma-semialdehyde dehydrogenase PutA n=1 Tax=Emcibacter sp. SYSU 3D8 TaxID=3133969 RepID=UPI0031FEC270